jgi:hypothetical protein
VADNGNWWDALAKLRYGVDANQKYALAVSGRIPGSLPIRSEDDLAREERRAAAYLFSMQNPRIADFGVGLASTLRFTEPESMHAAAREGVVAGRDQPRTLSDLMGWNASR